MKFSFFSQSMGIDRIGVQVCRDQARIHSVTPPGLSISSIPLGGELIPDPVGFGVILGCFGCLACRDGCINGAVVEAGGGFRFRAQSQHRARCRSSCQRPARSFQLRLRQGGVFPAFQPVGEGPQGLGQIEQHGQSARAVEVIVHGADEALFELHQSGVGWTPSAVMAPSVRGAAVVQPRLSPWRSPRLRAAFRPFQPVAAASRASAVKSSGLR